MHSYVCRLADRKVTSALPLVETVACGGDPGDAIHVLNLYYAAFLGSWNAFDTMLAEARAGGVLAPAAHRQLRFLTGMDFDYDWDAWQRWLARARTELQWDVETRSWQPADKWQQLLDEMAWQRMPNRR